MKTRLDVGRYKEAGLKTEMSEEFSEENVNAGKIEIPKMKIGIGTMCEDPNSGDNERQIIP